MLNLNTLYRRNHRRALVRECSEGLRMWAKEFRGLEPWKDALVNPSENEELNPNLATEYENAARILEQLLVSKYDQE